MLVNPFLCFSFFFVINKNNYLKYIYVANSYTHKNLCISIAYNIIKRQFKLIISSVNVKFQK